MFENFDLGEDSLVVTDGDNPGQDSLLLTDKQTVIITGFKCDKVRTFYRATIIWATASPCIT